MKFRILLVAICLTVLSGAAVAQAHPHPPKWKNTIELQITKNGKQTTWAGWRAYPAIEQIAKHGLKPGTTAGLAWKHKYVARTHFRIKMIAAHFIRTWDKQPTYIVFGKIVPADVAHAIVDAFGPYAAQAMRVSYCESGWRTFAQNGQYLGLFQMGDYARARYGHGSDAFTQAHAAAQYFFAAGADWSPWQCKP